ARPIPAKKQETQGGMENVKAATDWGTLYVAVTRYLRGMGIGKGGVLSLKELGGKLAMKGKEAPKLARIFEALEAAAFGAQQTMEFKEVKRLCLSLLPKLRREEKPKTHKAEAKLPEMNP